MGRSGIGRLFFFFLYSGRVRESFDFQLIGGGEWRRIKFEIDAEGLNW